MYQAIIKPSVDYFFIILFFPIWLGLLLTIGFLSIILNGNKVIFVQKRPGKNSGIFEMYKFRTLDDEKKSLGKFFSFLRKSGLDEIPQIINVIRGDMSLVGPRPLLVKYLDRYTPEQSRRHELKPGITGWAQVNMKNIKSWNSLFDYDLEYLKNSSFLFDLKILCLTVILKTKALFYIKKEPSSDPIGLGVFTS